MCASYSSARVKRYWMKPCSATVAPTPTRISLLPDSPTRRTTRAMTIAPPAPQSATSTPSASSSTKAKVAAALAPMPTPMMSGEASGLRSAPWKIAPATPKARPTSTASTARGSFVSIRMKVAVGICLSWKMIASASGTVKVKSPSRTRARNAPVVARVRPIQTVTSRSRGLRRAARTASTCSAGTGARTVMSEPPLRGGS
jgi:hypothetical protein